MARGLSKGGRFTCQKKGSRSLRYRQHGAPSKVWIYRETQGQPLMALYRFDLALDEDGKTKKVFAPLTWCQSSDNQTVQWRWQGLPEPRPLLRLHELSLQADATVVLCEGEKAADAAAELFPDYVATCWPNGSNAWHKADLSPLKNRKGVLWPDNDPSGTTCMDAVAKKLEVIGAEPVRVIALENFKRKPTLKNSLPGFAKGGAWEQGDDAADALTKVMDVKPHHRTGAHWRTLWSCVCPGHRDQGKSTGQARS